MRWASSPSRPLRDRATERAAALLHGHRRQNPQRRDTWVPTGGRALSDRRNGHPPRLLRLVVRGRIHAMRRTPPTHGISPACAPAAQETMASEQRTNQTDIKPFSSTVPVFDSSGSGWDAGLSCRCGAPAQRGRHSFRRILGRAGSGFPMSCTPKHFSQRLWTCCGLGGLRPASHCDGCSPVPGSHSHSGGNGSSGSAGLHGILGALGILPRMLRPHSGVHPVDARCTAPIGEPRRRASGPCQQGLKSLATISLDAGSLLLDQNPWPPPLESTMAAGSEESRANLGCPPPRPN